MSCERSNLGQNEPHSGSDFLLSYFDQSIDQSKIRILMFSNDLNP